MRVSSRMFLTRKHLLVMALAIGTIQPGAFNAHAGDTYVTNKTRVWIRMEELQAKPEIVKVANGADTKTTTFPALGYEDRYADDRDGCQLKIVTPANSEVLVPAIYAEAQISFEEVLSPLRRDGCYVGICQFVHIHFPAGDGKADLRCRWNRFQERSAGLTTDYLRKLVAPKFTIRRTENGNVAQSPDSKVDDGQAVKNNAPIKLLGFGLEKKTKFIGAE
ncbi:MAG: hypothetical protein HY074_03510 [Deltaproteobacteria bacterium]|nr:hypothetical protein [Deltaproteobacteria bacterium]